MKRLAVLVLSVLLAAACFHFSNMQPLWMKDNFTKGDKSIICPDQMILLDNRGGFEHLSV